MPQPKYQVDLIGQQAECEANFLRVLKLMPDLDSVDQRDFAVSLASGQTVRLRLLVTERCRYTTMIELHQLQGTHAWSPRAQFDLRLYHDARMVEVVSYRRQRAVEGRYDYPNQRMFQRDEKSQLNSFLGEWLSHCLHHGYAVDATVASDLG